MIRSSPNKKWDFFNLHIGSRISFGVFDVNDVGLLDLILDPVVWFGCFSCDCVWVLLYMVVSWLDMVKLTGRVGSGQTGHMSKRVILSGLKMGSGQTCCKSGWPVFFTWIFLFFIFIKKTTCICHLESYETNYLM